MARGLGEFEQLILLALVDLRGEEAYGVPIRESIARRTGREISTGAVYTALDRLQSKGLVSSRMGQPTAERGGRRKRLYRLRPAGARALRQSVRTLTACPMACSAGSSSRPNGDAALDGAAALAPHPRA
jgi:DNA-binding PadR family transcriptional regulator